MAKSPVAILYTSDQVELPLKGGASLPSDARGFLGLVLDGSTVRFVAGDGSGRPIVVGAGTAGTPGGGVVSIQGVSSGTAVPISAASLPLPTNAATDRTTAAAPFSVRLSDGSAFYNGTKTEQLPSALVGGRLDENVGAWMGSTAPTVGRKTMAASLPITLASDQPPISVSVGNPNAIPVTVAFDRSEEFIAAAAGYFKIGCKFQIPVGYRFVVSQYAAWSFDNRCSVRVSDLHSLGTWDPSTYVYTAIGSGAYTAPQFGQAIELLVTSTMGNVNDQVITISYTNHLGTSGRTATAVGGLKLKKNTPANYKIQFSLQEGDVGVSSIQSITADATNTGAVEARGVIEFYSQDITVATTTYITVSSSSPSIIPAQGYLVLDYSSSGGATGRRYLKCMGLLEAV